MRTTLAWATLRRHPARTTLAILGIAVAAALLLDMVMLATGMRTSFRALMLTRGYQLRIAPKGTLPFDSEATIDGADAIVAALRANPDIKAVSPSLGTTLAMPDQLVPSVFTLGLASDVQGDYVLEQGRDIPVTAADTGVLPAVVSRMFLMRTHRRLGDTLTVSAGADAQLRSMARSRTVVLVGEGRFYYVPNETPVMALPLASVRRLSGPTFHDRMSLAMAEVRRGDSASVEAARAWIGRTQPRVNAISTETAIRQVEERLSYFRQLAFVLGAISLGIGFLLVATLITLSVNERRGEIAVLRAIGTSSGGVLRQVFLEGFMLSGAGIVGGLGLGLVTARWLNGILSDFPGLPASFDFFVWTPDAAWRALAMLLVSGSLAGLLPAWRAASIPIARALREEAIG
ncbi:MAG: ABC transporter permease [Gemmatimonadaceae bacterium]|nr:ABC transporter permease [Gemmatimonadaceae bacterium]